MNRISKLAIASCVALLGLVVVGGADAQVGRGPVGGKTEPIVATGDKLNKDSLNAMLRSLGYEPRLNTHGNAHLVVNRDGWTFEFDVTVAGSGTKIWLSCWFNQLPRELSANELAALLKANLDFGPAHFTYDAAKRQLNMGMPVDNRGVNSEVLRAEINTFVDTLKRTADLWDVR